MNPLKAINDALGRNVAAPLSNVASQLDNLGIVFRGTCYELTERLCDAIQPRPTLCLAFLVQPSDGSLQYWAGAHGNGSRLTLCATFERPGQIKAASASSMTWMIHTVTVGGRIQAYGGAPLQALWLSEWPKVQAQETIQLEMEWMP